MTPDLNAVIISGKVYEAIPKGSRHCSDCDLYDRCNVLFADLCALFAEDTTRMIFRYSQSLTDKINQQ